MNKEVLRKVYLEKRLMLSRDEWDRRSEIICQLFFDRVDLSMVKHLHLYLPMEDRNEPDAWRLLERLKSEKSDILVCVSRTLWKEKRLQHFLYETPAQLEMNKFSIPEPIGGREVADEDIDMVLVPLIAFDREGNRIGYGGGFYDRFLDKLPETCQRVGYTISTPLDEIPYMEDFDIPLDGCICPLGVYWFN